MKNLIRYTRKRSVRLAIASTAISLTAMMHTTASFADAIVIDGASYHISEHNHPDSLSWNVINSGLGFQKEVSNVAQLQVGFYKNSIRNTELFVTDLVHFSASPLQLGGFMGARTFKSSSSGDWLHPGAGLLARFNTSPSSFMALRWVPRANKNASATFMVEAVFQIP